MLGLLPFVGHPRAHVPHPGPDLVHFCIQYQGPVVELQILLPVFEIVNLLFLCGGAAQRAHAAHLFPLADARMAVLVVAAGHGDGLVQRFQADHAVHYLYLIYMLSAIFLFFYNT